jgi:hypothetical protein
MPETESLKIGLQIRGIPFTQFHQKNLQRRRVTLAKEILVAGHIPVVLGALRQLGIEPPQPNDYPHCLQPWLHRKIWYSSVRDVVTKVQEGRSRPFFAKPLDKHKRFRGHLFQSWDDLRALGGVSEQTPVICSEAVTWKSEFRFYVVAGVVVGTGHYAGDKLCEVDRQRVDEAVVAFQRSGEAPAGYAIDFGVLDTGETALVEVNDGYALGSYGLCDQLYTDLIVARWLEMVGLKA